MTSIETELRERLGLKEDQVAGVMDILKGEKKRMRAKMQASFKEQCIAVQDLYKGRVKSAEDREARARKEIQQHLNAKTDEVKRAKLVAHVNMQAAQQSSEFIDKLAGDALYTKSVAELDGIVKAAGHIRANRRQAMMEYHKENHSNFSKFFTKPTGIIFRNYEDQGVMWGHKKTHRNAYTNQVFLRDLLRGAEEYLKVNKPLIADKTTHVPLPPDFPRRSARWLTGQIVEDQQVVRFGQFFDDDSIYKIFPINWNVFCNLRKEAGKCTKGPRGEVMPDLKAMYG